MPNAVIVKMVVKAEVPSFEVAMKARGVISRKAPGFGLYCTDLYHEDDYKPGDPVYFEITIKDQKESLSPKNLDVLVWSIVVNAVSTATLEYERPSPTQSRDGNWNL